MSNIDSIIEEQDEKIKNIHQVVKRIKPMTNLIEDEINHQSE